MSYETVVIRTLIGTCVIDEVRLAVQNVYKVIEIMQFTNTLSRSMIRRRVRAVSLSST